MNQTIAPCNRMQKRNTFLKHLIEYRYLLVMLLPAVIFFVIFNYVPMGGLVIAFKKFDYSLGIFGSKWAGLDNFQYLFKSGKLLSLLSNTVLYNSIFIVIGTFFQVMLSIIISELSGKHFKKFCQSAMFLPYFISWVVVGTMAYNMLNYRYGFVNSIINLMGQKTVNFYANTKYWPFLLTFIHTWKGVGYGSVVYLAAITGIDNSLYEAAQIDGASLMQRIRYITLPCLKSTIIILILMSIGNIFRGNFQMFWNVVGQNSILFPVTDVIDTYVYRSMMNSSDYGMTGAAGLVQSVLCFITIIAANGVIKKVDSESALF